MKKKITQEQVAAYAVDYIKGRNSGIQLADKFNALYDSVAAVKYKDRECEVAHRRILAQSIVIDCIIPLSLGQLNRLEANFCRLPSPFLTNDVPAKPFKAHRPVPHHSWQANRTISNHSDTSTTGRRLCAIIQASP